ncbi:MAG: hypothetical protein E6J28_14955 [Chloroflexi bacterium]|nr:MAG: hypothetical protein E6J28_14955 [Chloroflexota bacterium]
MDDYQKEIADLETQVEQLVEAEGDAKTIAELSMQLDILKAIYARSTDLLTTGCATAFASRAMATGPSTTSTRSSTSDQSRSIRCLTAPSSAASRTPTSH